MAETKDHLVEKIKLWKQGLEERGLRVNMGKTKVLKCRVRMGQKGDSGKWPCGVCRKGVGSNSIYCVLCKWIHKARSGVKGKLTSNDNFQCSKCTIGESDDNTEFKELSIGNTDKVDRVDRFV